MVTINVKTLSKLYGSAMPAFTLYLYHLYIKYIILLVSLHLFKGSYQALIPSRAMKRVTLWLDNYNILCPLS